MQFTCEGGWGGEDDDFWCTALGINKEEGGLREVEGRWDVRKESEFPVPVPAEKQQVAAAIFMQWRREWRWTVSLSAIK